ncbi:MAG: fibronectin type III domain-containing protein [Saprospiraceae bacterium]|jgi:hypothetical protein
MARILFLMMFPFVCFSQITPSEDIPVNNLLKEKENLDTKRKASYNLDEIKVRWKKAALENCPGVPCVTNTAPGAPTNVVATAGNASAIVAFTAPASNGGSVITGYTVTSSPGGISATGPSSPINVPGLTNTTPYTFRVVATNAIGNSEASTPSTSVTPVAPATAPGIPTSVVASVVNSTTVNLTFTAPYNGGSVITSYEVELRWRDASESSAGVIDYILPTTLPMVFTGLTTGYKYSFKVKAVNAVGVSDPSGLSNWVTP